jgi:hypothetical protein
MIKRHILDFINKKERGMNRSLRALSQRMSVCTSVMTLSIMATATIPNMTVV